MVDYAKLAATAKRLIEANGRSVTLFKSNTVPANAGQPWRGPDSSADPEEDEGGETLTVTVCFVPARGTNLSEEAREREETIVKDGVEYALIATNSLPDGTNVREFNAMQDGDNLWRVKFVGELRPGGTGLMWEAELSK